MEQGLPVHGYRPQSKTAINTVNINKELEERVLQVLDDLTIEEVDQRWLAIGRTHIEQGFMAINRAIFKPSRVTLTSTNPSDEAIPF